jgi:YVTN family beta-propeller protein
MNLRRSSLSPSAAVFFLFAPLLPAFAGAPIENAWVIHGNDRSLARVALPSGPSSLNVASLGSFPNEMAVRGSLAYIVCSGSHAIHVVDLLSGSPVDTIPTGAGTNPFGIIVVSDSRAFVTLLATNQVAVLDLVAGSVTGLIPVGRSPEGIVEANGRLFVANSGFDFSTFDYDPGTVSVIDEATLTVTQTLPVGLNPQDLDVAPNGTVHVCCTGNYFSVFGRAFVINPLAPAVTDSLDTGGSPGFVAIDDAGDAYLSDYFLGLLKYDTATLALLRDSSNPIPVGLGAAGVDFDQAGRAYVCVYEDDQLVELDPADTIVQTFPLGDGPQDVWIRADEEPVSVVLNSFSAASEPGGVRLSWTTAEERDHVGFHVYRSSDGGATWVDAAGGLIPHAAGGVYSWLDVDAATALREGAVTLSYRLGALDRSGHEDLLASVSVTIGSPVPTSLAVTPNPARRSGTRVVFDNSTSGPARVTVFDLAGRAVAVPFDGSLDAGLQSIPWDARGADGSLLPAGVYFVRIETASGDARTARVAIVP